MIQRGKRILFICGSLNQTAMMHQIAQQLCSYECWFTPFYFTGIYEWFENHGWLDFTIAGGFSRQLSDEYIADNRLPIDYRGKARVYDLVVTGTDLVVQDNIKGKPFVLVQEGMTDPETLAFHVVKALRATGFPRWVAKTSTTGLSDEYTKFCVASEGYRDLFVRKGARREKIIVTGIPNWDNAEAYCRNDFPHQGYVLVCTSDIRENYGFDNRIKFLRRVKQVAGDRLVIVKFHPNENIERATREVTETLPNALIYHRGNAHQMVANCAVLFTQYSTLVYTGLALGKRVYSYFDITSLRELVPKQNGGMSAKNIAAVCEQLL